MFDKMKQMMEMKKQAENLKRELDNMTVDVNPSPGIAIKIDGSQKFRSIELDASLLQADKKNQLEQALLKSVNAAIMESQRVAAQKMKDIMPGFPGM